jgi:hypothetical protein
MHYRTVAISRPRCSSSSTVSTRRAGLAPAAASIETDAPMDSWRRKVAPERRYEEDGQGFPRPCLLAVEDLERVRELSAPIGCKRGLTLQD